MKNKYKVICARTAIKCLERSGWDFEDEEETIKDFIKAFSHKAYKNELVDAIITLNKRGWYFCTKHDVIQLDDARKIYKKSLNRYETKD
jgi:hypothetical protein